MSGGGSDLSCEADADEIETKLRAIGDPERAANERRYLKSDLEFIGVGVPGVRAVVRDYLRQRGRLEREQALGLVGALWARAVHERRMAALELLDRHERLLHAGDIGLVEG